MNSLTGWLSAVFDFCVRSKLPYQYEPRSPMAKNLLHATRVGSHRQGQLMGRLRHSDVVTPELFQRYMENIARGMDYIHERFGTEFDRISIIDERNTVYTHHDRETHEITLILTLYDIEEMCESYNKPKEKLMQSKTQPHLLNAEDMTTLYGVEEAYHQHQFRTQLQKYQPHVQPLQDVDNPRDDYEDNLIERDAEIIVREAALHFGYWTDTPKQSMDRARQKPRV